ncbi:MAG: hypothetical protein ACI9YL_000576, partial [Luteibaculaceae bacterium]
QLLIEQVREGQTSPFRGAEELLQQF